MMVTELVDTFVKVTSWLTQKQSSPEIKTRVYERYGPGERVVSVTKAFDIHQCTVFVLLKEAGYVGGKLLKSIKPTSPRFDNLLGS